MSLDCLSVIPAQKLKPRGRVLLAEDDDTSRSSLQAVLEQHFDVFPVSSVGEAFHRLRTRDIDVLVTGFHLTDGTGIDLLNRGSVLCPHLMAILLANETDLLEVVAARRDRRVFRIALQPYDPAMLIGWVVGAKVVSQMRKSGTRRKVSG